MRWLRVKVPVSLLNAHNNYVSTIIDSEVIVDSITISYPTTTATFAHFKDTERSDSSSSAAQRERKEGTITDLPVGNDGKVTSDTVVRSADATTTLALYQGIQDVDASGYPVNKIIVTTPLFLPADTPAE
jgi:hypothetical protein